MPTNLKAAADGIIKRIDVTSGNCIVKVGDTVAKGDILVSGMEERADGTKFVHSAGRVTAVIEREVTVTAKCNAENRRFNGTEKNQKGCFRCSD